jgi:hypothetical protein
MALVLDGSGLEHVPAWSQMLPRDAVVKLTMMDTLRKGRMSIYYKIEEHR